MILLEVIAVVLVADFVSGFFHWMEDAYGREHWLVTGALITKPNVLHHHEPRYFTRHSWLYSARLLIPVGLVVLVTAWIIGLLTWQVWLFVVLGVNANEVHKWAHRTQQENGRVISWLQRLRLVQSSDHHAGHHTNPKNTRYCVLTNVLNPVLDRLGFWQGLEVVIRKFFGVSRRPDPSVPSANRANAGIS